MMMARRLLGVQSFARNLCEPQRGESNGWRSNSNCGERDRPERMVGSCLRQAEICRSREVEFGIVGAAGAASGAVRVAARAELAGDISSDTADAGVVAWHRGVLLSGLERPALVVDG